MSLLFLLRRQCWLFLLFCLLALPVQAAIDVGNVGSFLGRLSLGPYVQLLEDREHKFSIDDVVHPEGSLKWRASDQDAINFGFSDSTWWLQVELTNFSEVSVPRFLELSRPLHDYLSVWVVDESGVVVQHWETGCRLDFATRPLAHRGFVFPTMLPPGKNTVFMQFDSHDGLFEATQLYLMNVSSFVKGSEQELMIFSVYFGALLALIIYSFMIYIAIRDRSLLYYVVYLGSLFVLIFVARGFTFQYLWPTWPTFNKQMLPLSAGVFIVLLAFFSSSYLNLRQHAPRWNKVVYGLAGACLLSVLPALQGHYASVFRFVIPLGILISLLILGLSIWRSWLGDTSARIFLVARSVLLVGIALYFLGVAGVLPYGAATEYAIQAGSGLEFFLLASGLAYKINQLKNEKLAAVRTTHSMLRTHNQLLESKVVERTHELEKANRQLAAQADTDPLTGLLNRRQFHELVDDELRRRRRGGRALLFAMMDIDAFKRYNDTYGHQAGDDVLCRISGLMQQHFRRAGDRLFRLGGEEFGLLLEADTLEAGQRALEGFREAIETLAIPNGPAAENVVTASFGLVYCSDFQRVPNVGLLYQQADEAMYEAKQRGRNQVITRSIHCEHEG